MKSSKPHKVDKLPVVGNFYGRRQGRPLRTGRRKLIEEHLPTFKIPVPTDGKITINDFFSTNINSIWLEIGFGAGEHLAFQAKKNPRIGIIGCELFVNGIASLLRHVNDESITNVRIVEASAGELVRALPDTSIDRIFLLFPDPWPKKRHHKRRIIQPEFLAEIARILSDGAQFRFATDHRIYARWALEAILSNQDFVWMAESADHWKLRPGDWPQTRYEASAQRSGASSLYFTFNRKQR